MYLNPKVRFQENEQARRKLANITADGDVQDAMTLVLAILARNAAAMPDASPYLRGAKEFVHEFLNLPIIGTEKKIEPFGIPNPLNNK